jgi:hypothetical protein
MHAVPSKRLETHEIVAERWCMQRNTIKRRSHSGVSAPNTERASPDAPQPPSPLPTHPYLHTHTRHAHTFSSANGPTYARVHTHTHKEQRTRRRISGWKTSDQDPSGCFAASIAAFFSTIISRSTISGWPLYNLPKAIRADLCR